MNQAYDLKKQTPQELKSLRSQNLRISSPSGPGAVFRLFNIKAAPYFSPVTA